jgi:hypothetical protein
MNTFSEKQKFRQWWLWVILIGVLLVPVVLTLINKPAQADLFTEIMIGLIAPAVIVLLFVIMELRTQVNEQGIFYRFFPIHFQVLIINWDEVKKAYIRKYSPLGDFGGWGIRLGLGGKGKAYNVDGNMGLQIELKTGKKILIGTQKPEEMQALLAQLVKAKVLKADAIKE